jgi:hypothetical protein
VPERIHADRPAPRGPAVDRHRGRGKGGAGNPVCVLPTQPGSPSVRRSGEGFRP